MQQEFNTLDTLHTDTKSTHLRKHAPLRTHIHPYLSIHTATHTHTPHTGRHVQRAVCKQFNNIYVLFIMNLKNSHSGSFGGNHKSGKQRKVKSVFKKRWVSHNFKYSFYFLTDKSLLIKF